MIWGKLYTTGLICVIASFLYADQNLMAPNLSAIAKDFGYSDEERDEKLGGDIAFGFFVLGAPAAILIGYLADTVNRCILLGFVVLLGESACLGTYFITTYPQLFVCRMLTGISIGGATPVIFSLMADYYPEGSRIYVSTWVGIAISIGQTCGQLMSGLVGPAYGWRTPFLIIALPALLLGAILIFTGREPKRGSQERVIRKISESISEIPAELLQSLIKENQKFTSTETPTESTHHHQDLNHHDDHDRNTIQNVLHTDIQNNSRLNNKSLEMMENSHENISIDYSEKIDCAKISTIFRTPSSLLIFAQGLPGCIPWSMIYTFLNDYFSSDKGMSVQQATLGITIFGIGGMVGQLFGGWVGQWLYLKDHRYQNIFMGSSVILSVLPMIYLLNSDLSNIIAFFLMLSLAGFIACINGPNVRSVLQNVSSPEVRGTAFAVYTLTDDIGKGAGPLLLVQLLKVCGGHRREAFNIAVFFWVICGVFVLLLVFTVIKDEDSVQNKIIISLQQNNNNNNKYIPIKTESEYHTVDQDSISVDISEQNTSMLNDET